MEMTLSRALRYKKRVIEDIRKLEADVQGSNSVVEGEERSADIKVCMSRRSALVRHLIALKLAIVQATEPIRGEVLEYAETKSEIAYLSRIDTKHGTIKPRYQQEQALKYDAVLKKSDVDAERAKLQDRIDALQTKIDGHNNNTTVTVPDVVTA